MYAWRASRPLLSRVSLRPLESATVVQSRRSFHATVRRGNLAALKELRALSGAPMMECKKALDESENEMEKALDWLRSE